MKSKLIATLIMLISLNCSAQFFYQKIAKSTYNATSAKPVTFKSGTIKVTTTKGKVTALLNGKTFLLATPPANEDVQVTAYDLNGDNKPEILVAYFDAKIAQSKLFAFDGITLKKLGEFQGGSYYELSKGTLISCIPHHEITEKHIYHLKNGKFVLDEKNSIY